MISDLFLDFCDRINLSSSDLQVFFYLALEAEASEANWAGKNNLRWEILLFKSLFLVVKTKLVPIKHFWLITVCHVNMCFSLDLDWLLNGFGSYIQKSVYHMRFNAPIFFFFLHVAFKTQCGPRVLQEHYKRPRPRSSAALVLAVDALFKTSKAHQG